MLSNRVWATYGLNLLHEADDDAVVWLKPTVTAALAKYITKFGLVLRGDVAGGAMFARCPSVCVCVPPPTAS